MKEFSKLFVAAINDPAKTTPGAKAGKVVVWQQTYSDEYALSATKAQLGATSSNDGHRRCSEFWSMEELASANGGAGLSVGDQLDGVSISSLSSTTPFYQGQTPFVKTGLYYSPVLEAGAPRDRQVAVSADFKVQTVAAPAAVGLDGASATPQTDAAQAAALARLAGAAPIGG